MVRQRTILCYLIICVKIQIVYMQIANDLKCDGTITVGRTLTGQSEVNSNRAFGYLAENPDFTIECCGRITQWEFRAGNLGTLQVQVWRHLRTGSYLLVGENYCLVAARNVDILCTVAVQDQFMVQKGDIIGWHSNGEDLLLFEQAAHFTDSTLPNMHRRIRTGDLYPGDPYDWSGVEAYNDYDYALLATVETSTEPTITVITPVPVPDYLVTGTTITRVTYSDADTADNSNPTFYQTETVPYYSVDLISGYVVASNDYRPRAAILKYAAYDQCYNTATATQTFTITDTTVTIDNLPADFTISEDITAQTLLHTVTVTDPVDQIYCYSIDDGTWNDVFMLKPESENTFGFYITEYPDLGPANQSTFDPLSLTIQCGENNITSSTPIRDALSVPGLFKIYLTPNLAPVITNLDDSVLVDATSAHIGDTVFSTTATDPENDALKFTAVCTTRTGGTDCPLQMQLSGHVQVTDWLIYQTDEYYRFAITVTDVRGNTDTGILSILIQNVDNAAVFTNVPTAGIEIPENTPVGTPLYTLEYSDSNNDAKVFTMKYDDDRAGRLFNIDPASGQISTAFSEYDYETEPAPPRTFELFVELSDIKLVVTATVTITFVDVNEAPWFTEDDYNFVVDEGLDGFQVTDGTQDSDFTNITVIDPDAVDAHRYSLDCGSDTHRFYINRNDGTITFNGDYDLDTSGTPDSVDCTVTVTDKGGLSDTAALNIYINNVNEFAPQFTQGSYIIFVSPYALIGSKVAVVTAFDLDIDLDGDKDIIYGLNQSTLANPYFHIGHTGIIYTVMSLQTLFSQTLDTFDVIAYDNGDNGANVRTGTASVTVTIAPSTTTAATTTTTDSDYQYYNDYRSYIWLLLVGGGIFVVILTISIVLFIVCRLRRIPAWFMRHFFPPKPPPRPVTKSFGEHGRENEGFLHDHKYTDEDDVEDGWFKRKYETAIPVKDQPKGEGFSVEPEIHEMFRVPSAASYKSPPSAANDEKGDEERIPSPTIYTPPTLSKEATIPDWDSAYPDVERYYRPYTWKRQQHELQQRDFV